MTAYHFVISSGKKSFFTLLILSLVFGYGLQYIATLDSPLGKAAFENINYIVALWLLLPLMMAWRLIETDFNKGVFKRSFSILQYVLYVFGVIGGILTGLGGLANFIYIGHKSGPPNWLAYIPIVSLLFFLYCLFFLWPKFTPREETIIVNKKTKEVFGNGKIIKIYPLKRYDFVKIDGEEKLIIRSAQVECKDGPFVLNIFTNIGINTKNPPHSIDLTKFLEETKEWISGEIKTLGKSRTVGELAKYLMLLNTGKKTHRKQTEGLSIFWDGYARIRLDYGYYGTK